MTLIGSNRYIEVRFRLFQIWRRGGIEWSAPTGNGGHDELARGSIGNEIRTEYCGLYFEHVTKPKEAINGDHTTGLRNDGIGNIL